MEKLQPHLKKILLPEIFGFIIINDLKREYEGNKEAGRPAITTFSRKGDLPRRLANEIIKWVVKHDKENESNPKEGIFCSTIPTPGLGFVATSVTVDTHASGSFWPLEIEVEITHS